MVTLLNALMACSPEPEALLDELVNAGLDDGLGAIEPLAGSSAELRMQLQALGQARAKLAGVAADGAAVDAAAPSVPAAEPSSVSADDVPASGRARAETEIVPPPPAPPAPKVAVPKLNLQRDVLLERQETRMLEPPPPMPGPPSRRPRRAPG